MCCAHILTTGQSPAVEVVDVIDLGNRLDFLLNFLDVNALWCELHQNSIAVLGNLNGSCKYNDRKHKCQDRVKDLVFWVEVNDEASDDNTDRLDQVTHHVDKGGSYIQILLCILVNTNGGGECTLAIDAWDQSVGVGAEAIVLFIFAGAFAEGYQVDDVAAETEDSSGDHDLWIHWIPIEVHNSIDAPESFVYEPEDHDPNDDHASEGAEHLSPMVSIGVSCVWLTKAVPNGYDADSETSDIREHVGGISHNGYGVRDISTKAFNDHEYEADENDTAQLTLSLLRFLQLLHELLVILENAVVRLQWTCSAV